MEKRGALWVKSTTWSIAAARWEDCDFWGVVLLRDVAVSGWMLCASHSTGITGPKLLPES